MAIQTGVAATRVPGRRATIDNSQAVGPSAATSYKALLIGIASAGSSGPTDTVTQIFGGTDGQQWGEGGMMDRMVTAFKAINTTTPLYAIAQPEGGGATKATQAITVPASTATANGTLHMYIAGQYTPVAVTLGDDEDAIAASIAAAINAKTSLPVTSSATLAVATNTTKFAGLAGGLGATKHGQMTVQFNRGIREELPAGVVMPTVVYVAGTADPALTAAIAAMVDEQYTHILMPYQDTTNQDLMKVELDTRFGPEDQMWGISFTPVNETTANLLVYGAARNSQVQVYPSVDPGTASPDFEWGAALLARVVANPDPAAPNTGDELAGILGAPSGDRRSRSERDSLLNSGIATTRMSTTGAVQIERVITSYQTNPANAPDVSYLDVQTPLTNCVFRDAINNHFSRFEKYKLAGDGNTFGAGQKIMTPSLAKTEIIGVAEVFHEAGLIEDLDGFVESLIVERNATDKNQLDYSASPDVVNQFRNFHGVIAFKL